MARIPRDIIEILTLRLNNLSDATRRAIEQRIRMLEYDSIADLRIKLIDVLEPFFENATNMAATYAADAYDETREAATGKRLGAVPDSQRIPKATEEAIRAFVGELDKGGIEKIIRLIQDRADYEIKKSAAQSTLANAKRDPLKPRYARVPTGAETCEFCIMLASRGFVYHSDKSAGALDHWHPHCDCRVVAGFDGYTEVEGYDTNALYDKWKEMKSKRRKHDALVVD